jgi:hypothetical protein
MAQESDQRVKSGQEARNAPAEAVASALPWEEPKLTFIEPRLTKHGQLEVVTAAFFGGFTP